MSGGTTKHSKAQAHNGGGAKSCRAAYVARRHKTGSNELLSSWMNASARKHSDGKKEHEDINMFLLCTNWEC